MNKKSKVILLPCNSYREEIVYENLEIGLDTYVEYGAADIGIVGKDTILEEGRKLYEVMDLGFGKCKMCVCGPESAREVLENNQLIRVATKSPNIAKD